MHRTKIGITVVAAAGLVLVGCSSSGDDTTTPSSSSASTSAPQDSPSEDDGGGEASADLVAWASELCGAIRPLEEEFTGLQGFAPTAADPEEMIDQMREMFGGLGPVFAESFDAVEAAGPPPVDGGDDIYDNMLTVLSTTGDAFDQIDEQLADVDPSDPAALESLTPIFAGIGEQLQQAGDELDAAFAEPDMKAAFQAAPGCDGLDMTSS